MATTRDWASVRKNLEEAKTPKEKLRIAQDMGYLNYESAWASMRSHEIRFAQKASKKSPEAPVVIQEELEEIVLIPEGIRQQLISTEWLPVTSLVINPHYQREEKTQWIREHAAKWEWLACRQLTVNCKTVGDANIYSVIDGQQRLACIKLQGFKEAPCNVYLDLDEQQEAMLFELLNQSTKINFNGTFKSRLFRGETVARAINNAVEGAGYHLDPERTHGGSKSSKAHFYIQTMRELERIYKDSGQGGPTAIMDVLKLIKEIWAPDYLEREAVVITGVYIFLKNYRGFSRPELIAKMKRKGQTKMIQMAHQWHAVHGGGGSGHGFGALPKGYCESMLAVYNENRQDSHRIRSKLV